MKRIFNKITASIFIFSAVSNLLAHEPDNWQDSVEPAAPNLPTHLIYTKHFKYQTTAYDDCYEHANSLGYTNGYCNQSSPDDSPAITAGWLRHEGTPNFDYIINFYDTYFLEIPEPEQCETAGNPCSLSSGVKTEKHTDFVSPGVNNLNLSRTYSSGTSLEGELGKNWQHNYSYQLSQTYAYTKKVPGHKRHSALTYHTEEDACVNGWSTMRNTAYRGLLKESTAVYEGGV